MKSALAVATVKHWHPHFGSHDYLDHSAGHTRVGDRLGKIETLCLMVCR